MEHLPLITYHRIDSLDRHINMNKLRCVSTFTSIQHISNPFNSQNMTLAVLTTAAVVATGGAAAPAVGAAIAGATTSGAGIGTAGTVIVGATASSAGLGTAGTAAAVVAGPVGWLVLGTSEIQLSSAFTYDCWKPIIHDQSPEPSMGKTLKEVAMDERVKSVIQVDNNTHLPHFIFENIWDEKFFIDYIQVGPNQICAHATKI